MTKVILSQFELSDIKRVVEEALEQHLKGLMAPERTVHKMLTRKQTAHFLCISLPTLHEWTKTGVIKAHRIGNRVLYKQDDVNNALKQIRSPKHGGTL